MKLSNIISLLTICIALIGSDASAAKKKLTQVPTVTLDDWRTINHDSIELAPSYLYMPLIFEKQNEATDPLLTPKVNNDTTGLNVDTQWIRDAIRLQSRSNYLRNNAINSHPEIVPYNINRLPEPPKQYIIENDPSQQRLTIKELTLDNPTGVNAENEKIKVRNWLHFFDGSLHFSQAYVSENWYQGGNNALNALLSGAWTVKLNQNIHPNYLFSNTVSYKLGLNSTPSDTIRNYNISEDIFQINTAAGIKAVKNWYYSANLQFKTQIFNNYPVNSRTLKAALFSPGELNVGVGMTYNTKSKDGWKVFSMSLAPISYNLKICHDIEKLNPVNFGIEAGKHTKSNIGSTLDAKFECKFTPSISWTSQIHAFTDYDFIQGDWQNTFNFSVNKYLSTMFYTHLRYDSSSNKDLSKWGFYQFKEILSFGLTYQFGNK